MDEYYIRVPEQEESRGPFNISKLHTLAEAGQVTENTLYYDENKEEWIPIALNEDLKVQVFPKAESLKLRIGKGESTDSSKHPEPEPEKEPEERVAIEDMLRAAEGDTDEHRHLKRRQEHFEKVIAMTPMLLGLMMLLSAISFLVPHIDVVQATLGGKAYTGLLNYPFLLVGVFDLIIAILLLLSVTEVYPLIRGRSMLGLGFGLYVGWALGDPLLMLAFGLGGIGLFLATMAESLSLMIAAIVFGLGGNGVLAFLAINGRFAEFYSSFQLSLFG